MFATRYTKLIFIAGLVFVLQKGMRVVNWLRDGLKDDWVVTCWCGVTGAQQNLLGLFGGDQPSVERATFASVMAVASDPSNLVLSGLVPI